MLTIFRRNSRILFGRRVRGALPAVAAAAVIGLCGCFRHSAPHRMKTAGPDDLPLSGNVEFFDGYAAPGTAREMKLTSFPSIGSEGAGLVRFSLRGQDMIGAVPEGAFEGIASVREVDLSETGISSLPSDFGALKSLRVLYLSGNAFDVFPEALCGMESLEYLNMDRNSVTSIPERVSGMTGLRWVRLNGNALGGLPDGAGEWKNIERLYLRGNSLDSVPEAVRAMKSLRQLDLGSNRITEIPAWISELEKLERLDVDGNSITNLPQAVFEMKSLRELVVNSCPIPEEKIREYMPAFELKRVKFQF